MARTSRKTWKQGRLEVFPHWPHTAPDGNQRFGCQRVILGVLLLSDLKWKNLRESEEIMRKAKQGHLGRTLRAIRFIRELRSLWPQDHSAVATSRNVAILYQAVKDID